MKTLFLAFGLFLSTSVYSGECTVTVDPKKDVKILWKAFKTPSKVGVGGSLRNFTYKGNKKDADIKDILRTANVEIAADSKSVQTKDRSRDAKISTFFFNKMAGGARIKARVTKVTEKELFLSVTMNDKEQIVPMNFKVENNKLTANGFLDILDFGMSKQLQSLNQACRAKHEGKTWSDVEIGLEIDFKTDC